jgi:hypothetical protein
MFDKINIMLENFGDSSDLSQRLQSLFSTASPDVNPSKPDMFFRVASYNDNTLKSPILVYKENLNPEKVEKQFSIETYEISNTSPININSLSPAVSYDVLVAVSVIAIQQYISHIQNVLKKKECPIPEEVLLI